MSLYSTDQITTLLNVHLASAFKNEDVTIFALSFNDEITLFLRINKPPIPQYGGETIMFGKTIRLLIALNKGCNLLSWLLYYNINQIAVTEAADPNLANKFNSTILFTTFLKSFFDGQATLKLAGLEELGVKAIINENANY